MRPSRLARLPLACLLGSAFALAGCSSAPAASSASSMIAPPATGSAWRVVGGEGSLTAGGTVAPGQPVIQVDGNGNLRATIPGSAETQQAAPALAPGSFGALQIRNAP
jgi:hypothetical protein